MGRPMVLLLAAWLVGICASPAVLAQAPSPSPDPVPLRVEMPEEGFAATFPRGWVIEVSGGESYAVSPDRSTRCLTTGEWFDDPIDDPAAVLDRVAAIYPGFSDAGPLPVIETSEVELPAGSAIRFIIDFELDPEFVESDESFGRYDTTYILADSLRLLFLSCWTPARADDDWLSIAETIEFLPAAESCCPRPGTTSS